MTQILDHLAPTHLSPYNFWIGYLTRPIIDSTCFDQFKIGPTHPFDTPIFIHLTIGLLSNMHSPPMEMNNKAEGEGEGE